MKKLLKPFGESDTKSKITEDSRHSRIKLTSKEKSELVFETVITIILLVLLNIAIIVVARQMTYYNQNLRELVVGVKKVLATTFNPSFYTLRNITLIVLIIIDIMVLFWRLVRRYRQMQLRHIISELHYIASGNYEHRIPFELAGDLGRVVASINGLVDSTLEAIQEERKIEESKDELITNISHDIRTPLTSIIGYLGLIEEKQYHSQEQLLQYTHTAYTKAKQMKLLVDDLFEYTTVRQPFSELKPIVFDMEQFLEQLAIAFEPEAQKRKTKIKVKVSHSPLIMYGDTDKLVRVFNNLISNALTYGTQGQTILLKAFKKKDEEVIIKVSNNGSTIPKKSLTLLFERFYRVDNARTQGKGGTGLGLSISQNIVNLHQGTIYAQSNKHWTVFIIHLPVNLSQVSKEFVN